MSFEPPPPIPKHFLLSGEPRDCSIDIQTEKVESEKCSGFDINSMGFDVHTQSFFTTDCSIIDAFPQLSILYHQS